MLTLQHGPRMFALGAAFLVGLTAVGCDEFMKPRRYNGPTGNPLPPSDGGTDADAGAYDPYGCEACVSPRCVQQQAVCNSSTTCLSIQQCAEATCGYDANCIVACANLYPQDPGGQSAYGNLARCEQAYTCTSACSGMCQPPAAYCR